SFERREWLSLSRGVRAYPRAPRAVAPSSLPGAAYVESPGPIDREIADRREQYREQWDADEERLADAGQPLEGRRQPFDDAFIFEIEGDGGHIAGTLQQGHLAQLVGGVVERDDRKRVGVQRDQHGDREIDAKSDREQRGRGELHGIAAGNESGKHADRHAASHRSAVQMPEIVVLQARAEPRDVAVVPDGVVTR